MTYSALSQVDRELGSNPSGSDASKKSPSPNPQDFVPLAIDFDNLGGDKFMDTAKVSEEPSSVSLKSIIRSRGASTTSYKILEDDDYKAVNPDKEFHDDHLPKNASPEPFIQNPVDRNRIALRHPVPDLQSIQGAYVGNVERLEKSAEELSMGMDNSSREELQSVHSGQIRQLPGSAEYIGSPVSRSRGVSIGSVSNPAAGGSAAVSPRGRSTAGYTPSPRQSALSSTPPVTASRLRSGSSASRLARVLEPQDENAVSQEPQFVKPIPPPPNPSAITFGPQLSKPPNTNHGMLPLENPPPEERPPTTGSAETYQQSTNLFKDFDGVHFTPHTKAPINPPRVSLAQPPLAAQPEHYNAPTSGESMVFYPAPVPMMLNLPQRLSKKPNVTEQEKRRTQLLNSLPAEGRKSAIWLPENDKPAEPLDHSNKRASNLPPQLRASAFFEQPPAELDLRVQQNSAVATLDSILDAAANAPVSAFTDHPIVGHVGKEVYGKSKFRKSRNKLDKQKRASVHPLSAQETPPSPPHRPDHIRAVSEDVTHQTERDNAVNEDEATPFHASYEKRADEPDKFTGDGGSRGSENGTENVHGTPGESDSEGDDSSEEDESYYGPPTTLLAELQMRKQEQKQRNRTAATAFPNGMHSTLLELDSVAQRQQEKRNQRHVTLAWEDPSAAEQREPDDEEVPLGVLFPEKSKLADENRPLGLMEKLQLDENEPLSRRRARMRGEPLHIPSPRNPSPDKRASTAYTLDLPGLTGADSDEDEEETLAQRVRRLKAREQGAKDDFASDLLSKFEGKPKEKDAETEEPEETLAQRRKRLQTQSQTQGPPADPSRVTTRRTMTDLLQAHPARTPGMQSERGFRQSTAGMSRQSFAMGGNPVSSSPHLPFNNNMPHYGNGMPSVNPMHNPNAMGNPMYGEPQAAIDPRQRDLIDRWRLSVRY